MNECPLGAICINGYCIVDGCPEGQYCRGDECVEGDAPDASPPVMMDAGVPPTFGVNTPSPSEDCGCDFSDGAPTSVWWLLALLYWGPARRRFFSR